MPVQRPRLKPGLWLLAALLAAGAGLVFWARTRPVPTVLPAPQLDAAETSAVLTAIQPNWPVQRPQLVAPGEAVLATEGRVLGVAAADVDGGGKADWGVSYAWLGPVEDGGSRAVETGFAVVTAGPHPTLVYAAPARGGWNGTHDTCFSDVSRYTGAVRAVSLGRSGVGFLEQSTLESAVGGAMAEGSARLVMRGVNGWEVAWEGPVESRTSSGAADERSTHETVDLRVDGGEPTILAQPDWYVRRLDAAGDGPNFLARLAGQWGYRFAAGGFHLSSLTTPARPKPWLIRAATPLLAVRAPGPVTIDGHFSDWDDDELTTLTGLDLADPSLLKYKRRPLDGTEDLSGRVRFMWDAANLYLRADVMDDHVVSGPPGKDLYKGDNVTLWLDQDLEGDFYQAGRSADDWQIGFTPGVGATPPAAYCWVPRPGAEGWQVASSPLRDPFTGTVRGYRLEAAIPWSRIGGRPPGLVDAPAASLPPQHGAPRRYTLDVAGVMGLGVVLSDTDKTPQELGYVSNPDFVWAEPTSFNTLVLVTPRRD